eukprot:UN31654
MSSLNSISSFGDFNTSIIAPPFELPFDIYDYLDNDNIDPLIVQLRNFLSRSEHTDEDWDIVLRWNNKELLRFLSTHIDNVSDKYFDTLLESLFKLLDTNPTSFAPALIGSNFVRRIFRSLKTDDVLSIFKRLNLLNILCVHAGDAFPDIPADEFLLLVKLVQHKHERAKSLAINTLLLIFLRIRSDELWFKINKELSSTAEGRIIDYCKH